MLKLGEIKAVDKRVRRWGGYIDQVWLAKNGESGKYILMGLVRLDNGNANGWCTLEQNSLSKCRAAATQF